MKYIIIVLVFIAFIGCDSSDNKKEIADEHKQNLIKESFPLNVEKDKTPPAIPKI